MAKFKSMGYNVLHIIPDVGEGYSWPELSRWLDEAERLDLWIMFDMRHQYQDPAWISRIVPMIAKRPNMLLWYTSDEPDGNEEPFLAPQRAYKQIKDLDPYHPISLCLNCENWHFSDYASGADILLSDTYPIGTNTTFSSVWQTECNTTYGDCGCDNCHGIDDITNIADRFDIWRAFQAQLGWSQKPLWTVPQAFGPEMYWRRPSSEEIVAMNMIAINHGAKGSVAWMWPTSEELIRPTSSLARVLTDPDVVRYTLGADLIRKGFDVKGTTLLDVAAWIVPNQGMLVSVVNTAHEDIREGISIVLPIDRTETTETEKIWLGDSGWQLASGSPQGAGITLVSSTAIKGMAVTLLTIGTVPRSSEVLTLPVGNTADQQSVTS